MTERNNINSKEIKIFNKSDIKMLLYSLFISLSIGFLFYQLQNIKSKPTFIINPLRSTVINYDQTIKSVPDSLTFKLEKIIDDDLNILNYYFFNQGKKPIKRENILKPIEICFSDSITKIISHKFIETGREECQITSTHTERCVYIDFKILEKYDGVIGQITYLGELDDDLSFSGTFEGVLKIKEKHTALSDFLKIGIIIFSSFFSLLLLFQNKKLRKQYRMVIIDEELFEEIGFIKLSKLNLLAISGIYSLLLILLMVVIAYIIGLMDVNGFADFIPPKLK
ncbi:MAG: hypothetical protein WD607_01320 [Candidatus Paceibacterota bacterium]